MDFVSALAAFVAPLLLALSAAGEVDGVSSATPCPEKNYARISNKAKPIKKIKARTERRYILM